MVVFVFCDILLSPLGFETRGPAILSNAVSLPWFGLLIGGLILNIVTLILLSFRGRASSIIALVGSVIYIFLLADQAGLIISIRPPSSITDVEIVTFVVLVVTLLYASRVYRETRSVEIRTAQS